MSKVKLNKQSDYYDHVATIGWFSMIKVALFASVSAVVEGLSGVNKVLSAGEYLATSAETMARDTAELTEIRSTGNTLRAKTDLAEEFADYPEIQAMLNKSAVTEAKIMEAELDVVIPPATPVKRAYKKRAKPSAKSSAIA